MTQPFDLNNKTRYTVWCAAPDTISTVYATNLSEWNADMIVNEMNSLDDSVDYRYAPMEDDDLVVLAYQEHMVSSNQEWDTPQCCSGLGDFLNQVHLWLLGEDVPPNSFVDIPLSLVEHVGQEIVDRQLAIEHSDNLSRYIAGTF